MREQRKGEDRIEYLARVLYEFMQENWVAAECTIMFDGVECDGMCLAEDFVSAVGVAVDDE